MRWGSSALTEHSAAHPPGVAGIDGIKLVRAHKPTSGGIDAINKLPRIAIAQRMFLLSDRVDSVADEGPLRAPRDYPRVLFLITNWIKAPGQFSFTDHSSTADHTTVEVRRLWRGSSAHAESNGPTLDDGASLFYPFGGIIRVGSKGVNENGHTNLKNPRCPLCLPITVSKGQKYCTAVVNSIDRSTEGRAPNRCLPFDGIGARHPR